LLPTLAQTLSHAQLPLDLLFLRQPLNHCFVIVVYVITKKNDTHNIFQEKKITSNLFKLAVHVFCKANKRQKNKKLAEHLAEQLASRTLKPYNMPFRRL